jgi:hypothetical protein
MKYLKYYQIVMRKICLFWAMFGKLQKQAMSKKMLPGDNLRVMSSIVANQRKSRYLATKQK